MTAITSVIQVDENLIHLGSSLSTSKLASVLRQLSHNASSNARVIVTLQNVIEEMRTTISQEQESTKLRFESEAKKRVELEDIIHQQAKKVVELEKNCARKDYVDKKLDELKKQLNRATDFIDEIEKGNGARVTKFIQSYLESFIPEWYAGVSAEMMATVSKMVQDTADTAAVNLEKRAVECEQKAVLGASQLQTAMTNHMYSLNEERKKELSKLRQDIYERFIESDNRTDLLVSQQKLIQSKRHTATRRRLQTIEESAAALRTSLCLEDGLCRELHNMAVRQTFSGDDTAIRQTLVSNEADQVADEKDVDTAFPGEQRKPDHPDMFRKLTVDETIRDIRVRRIAQAPHTVALRAVLQKEFNERMDYLKTDLHNDLISEIFDLQKELRGKVGTNKLGELLDQYRDESLYSNVKLLIQDMVEVKANKVETVLFVEGLRSKADLRQMESKADKSLLTEQIEALERRIELLTASTTRHENRIGRVEGTLMNARRGSAVASAVDRNASSAHSSGYLEDRRSGRGRGHKLSASPARSVSPPQIMASPFRRDSSGFGSPLDRDENTGLSATSSALMLKLPTTNQKGAKAVADIVDQIVERGFPSQIVVSEVRNLSKLHQTVVKTAHERHVQELMVTGGNSNSNTNDPDVELPSISSARNREASSAGSLKSPRLQSPSVTGSGTRGTRLHSAASSAVPPRAPSSGALQQRTEAPPTPAVVGPSLIPLTAGQQAYCEAVDIPSPANHVKGFSIGLKPGERRDY